MACTRTITQGPRQSWRVTPARSAASCSRWLSQDDTVCGGAPPSLPPPPAHRPVSASPTCCYNYGCFRRLDLEPRANLAKRSYSALTNNEPLRIREQQMRTSMTSFARRPMSAVVGTVPWSSPPTTPPALRLPMDWSRWASDRPPHAPQPALEMTNRYARVPTVHKVIQGFTKENYSSHSPPVLPSPSPSPSPLPSPSPVPKPNLTPPTTRGDAHVVSTSSIHDFRSPVSGYDATEHDDIDAWPSSAVLPLSPGKYSKMAHYNSHVSGAREASPVVPPPAPARTASRWSLLEALRRLRQIIERQRSSRRSSPAEVATKVPYFHRHPTMADSRPRSAAALSGLASGLDFVSATRGYGSWIQTPFKSLLSRASAASVSSAAFAPVEADAMPDYPSAADSSTYDESRVHDEHNGSRDNNAGDVHGNDAGGYSHDYAWKQDALSPLAAPLLRVRLEGELSSSYRKGGFAGCAAGAVL